MAGLALFLSRLRRLLGAGVLLSCVMHAQAVPPSKAPTRPSSGSSIRRANPAEAYVDLTSLGQRFGLKPQWTVPGKNFVLKSDQQRYEFEVGSREIEANGVRVFLGQPIRAGRGGIFMAKIDSEDLLPALIRPGFGQKQVPATKVIAIDPGHGGTDQGTENARLGLKEKTLTLDVSLRLKKILEAAGYRVVMTRTDDRQLKADKRADLQERAQVANRAGADLFISMHFNADPSKRTTKGIEVYAFTPQFQRSTAAWSGPSYDDTETDASPVNQYDHWNFYLAHAMQRRLLTQLRADDRGQKTAHWGVLRKLNCPGILVEGGFVTNEAEARKIATADYRQKIAEAMALGIRDYTTTLDRLAKR